MHRFILRLANSSVALVVRGLTLCLREGAKISHTVLLQVYMGLIYI